MFVQSIEFIQAHATGNGNAGKARSDISIYGQESNYTTWRMARMNLAIRGIEGQIAHGDSFHNDRHPDLRADYILANPPFNVSDWGGERLQDDQRWRHGVPPRGNANFAWVQHFLHHLAPRGRAGFVLANGSMSSNQSGEGQIRKNIVEAGLVDCIVALPGQLFRSTQIPACLWFLSRDRRRDETLFIDARNLGHMIDRTRRDLSPKTTSPTSPTPTTPGEVRTLRSLLPLPCRERAGVRVETPPQQPPRETLPLQKTATPTSPASAKAPPSQKSANTPTSLTPGRYVGAAPQEDDGEPFEQKMARLTAQWRRQQAEARRLDAAIEENLARLGFGTGQGSRAEG